MFMPEWSDRLPHNYGQLNTDITYQKGSLVEQWTITFEDVDKSEFGIFVIRFSPKFWNEIIEFEVLLNPINVDDFQGKDVTANW